MDTLIRKLTSIFLVFISGILTLSPGLNAQHAVATLCGTGNQGVPFSGPNGLCITPDGATIYAVDYSSHQIFRITVSAGTVIPIAGSPTPGYVDGSISNARFYYPSGIKISSTGNEIYVADNANCLIRKIDLANSFVSTVAGVYNAYDFADSSNGNFAKFNQPVDLVIAPGDSIIYISDSENHVIRQLNLNTTAVSTVAGTPTVLGLVDGPSATAKFRNPGGLALSSDGTMLYVADAGNHCIRKIDLATNITTTLAGTGTPGNVDALTGTQASFNIPQGVSALANDSLLYVMDTFNNLIRSINLTTSSVTTIAGSVSTPQLHFADNLNGLLSKFYHPVNGILSPDMQKLFITDQENFRIRIMNTDVVFTIINEQQATQHAGIFPNPASGLHDIFFQTSLTGVVEITSFNLLLQETQFLKLMIGQPGEIVRLPASMFNSGVNIIRISNQLNTIYEKLIIEK